MNDFASAVRAAARGILPERAFLRRDRGEGLFITDAPRVEPGMDWLSRATAAGFDAELCGGLMRLFPGEGWVARLEAFFPEPPDFLAGSLFRFAGMKPGGEALGLFAKGLRVLDGGGGRAAFERGLRQAAAVGLRERRGGGLYACVLLLYWIKEDE